MNFINEVRKHRKYVILSTIILLVLIFSLLPSDTVVIEEEEVSEPIPEKVIIKEEEVPLIVMAKSFDDFIYELKEDMRSVDIHVYRAVPPMIDPGFFVMPASILDWQASYISRWDTTINFYLPNRPELDLFLVLSVIGQESQGDEKLIAYNPDFINNPAPGVGLMMITPQTWIGDTPWLLSPSNNIFIGSSMLNSTIRDAREIHNFAPGLDSVRAGLAAYNCGWTSFLADKCYWFGGWAYADKVLLYWYPLLLGRYEGEFEIPDYFRELELQFQRIGT